MGFSTGMIKRSLRRLNHDEKEDNYGQTISFLLEKVWVQNLAHVMFRMFSRENSLDNIHSS